MKLSHNCLVIGCPVSTLVIFLLQCTLITSHMVQIRIPRKIEGFSSKDSLQKRLLPRLEKLLNGNHGKQLSPLFYHTLYQTYQDFGNAVTLGVYSLVLGSLTWVTMEIVTNRGLLCSTIFVTCWINELKTGKG